MGVGEMKEAGKKGHFHLEEQEQLHNLFSQIESFSSCIFFIFLLLFNTVKHGEMLFSKRKDESTKAQKRP